MSLSTVDLARARDTIATVLDELALEAYLFEVEPRNGQWEVKVELCHQRRLGNSDLFHL